MPLKVLMTCEAGRAGPPMGYLIQRGGAPWGGPWRIIDVPSCLLSRVVLPKVVKSSLWFRTPPPNAQAPSAGTPDHAGKARTGVRTVVQSASANEVVLYLFSSNADDSRRETC